MSSKRTTDKKRKGERERARSNYKIPPKEMIVTRKKYAQMMNQDQRQLREKNRGVMEVTQLTRKGAPCTPKTSPKAKGVVKEKTESQPSPSVRKELIMSQSPKKPSKSTSQSPVKTSRALKKKRPPSPNVTEEQKEFYPEKVKRIVSPKKITLEPKHELAKIAGVNKRKFSSPRKNSSYLPKVPKPETIPSLNPFQKVLSISGASSDSESKDKNTVHSDPYYGLTITEAVRLTDEMEELTDEDFMAILTCPSPVWWEDHPESIDDEPTIVNTQKGGRMNSSTSNTGEKPNKTTGNLNNVQDTKDVDTNKDEGIPHVIQEISKTKYDNKFLNKRSTLENLLINIKNKCTKNEKLNELDDDVILVSSNLKFNNSKRNTKSTIKRTKVNKKIFKKTSINPFKKSKKRKATRNVAEKKTKSTESGFTDLLLNVKDCVLNDLESINIPIERTNEEEEKQMPVDCIVIDDEIPCSSESIDPLCDLKPMEDVKVEKDSMESDLSSPLAVVWTDTATGDKKVVNIASCSKVITDNSSVESMSDDREIPTELPPLKKFPKVETPKRRVTENSESDGIMDTLSNNEVSDTISDTNIEFLMEDQVLYEVVPKDVDSDDLSSAESIVTVIETACDDRNNDTIEEEVVATVINKNNIEETQFFLKDKQQNDINVDSKKVNVASRNNENCLVENIDLDNLKTAEHIYVMIDANTGKEEYLRIIKVLENDPVNKIEPNTSKNCNEVLDLNSTKLCAESLQVNSSNKVFDRDKVKDDTKYVLKDKENVESIENNRETIADTEKFELEKNKLIAEKYESILRKKFSDKDSTSKRKVKSSNESNERDNSNERDMDVYIDVIQREKSFENQNERKNENNAESVAFYCKCCNAKVTVCSEKKISKYCRKCASLFDKGDCNFCFKISDNNHNVESSILCKLCKFKCCCAKRLRLHEVGHGVVESSCPLCNFRTKTPYQMQNHMWSHRLKSFQCTPKGFNVGCNTSK